MDRFTETYIKMVINNKQIQGLCKYNKGDWFIDDNSNIHVNDWNQDRYQEGYIKQYFGKFKWLPILDDLFGIWCNLGETTNFAGLCQRITNGKSRIVMRSYMKYIKELCLEAIMKEFYNKFWNGEEWEEINGS